MNWINIKGTLTDFSDHCIDADVYINYNPRDIQQFKLYLIGRSEIWRWSTDLSDPEFNCIIDQIESFEVSREDIRNIGG